MRPSEFAYARPSSLAELLELLARLGGTAAILAGGQSLVPALNRRYLRPDVVVDLARVEVLGGIAQMDDGSVFVGAMTRQQEILDSDVVEGLLPELATAVAKTGHRGTRNWGTVGGSAVHADPTGEIPAATVALEAEMILRSVSGERVVQASEFYTGAYQSDVRCGELLVGIRFPRRVWFTSSAFEEISRRHDDFAIAGAFACLRVVSGVVEESRIAVTGGARTPLRMPAIETALRGRAVDDSLLNEAADVVRRTIEPPDHLWAASDYRRQLVTVLTRRAIAAAAMPVARPTAHIAQGA